MIVIDIQRGDLPPVCVTGSDEAKAELRDWLSDPAVRGELSVRVLELLEEVAAGVE